jgi:transposase
MKRPEPLKVSRQELVELRERAKAGKLREEDAELVEALAETVMVLSDAVEQKSTGIRRLLRMLFGTKTEKKNKLFGPPSDQDNAKPPEAPGGGGQKPKAKGHGRNKADDYTGAKRVKLPHPDLATGTLCPGCERGRLYNKPPAKLLSIEASVPFTATVYECERFRCSGCGKTFTAPGPAGAAAHKYHHHVGILVALLKYGAGMPFARLENLQKLAGMPLPASVQWEQVAETAEPLWPLWEALWEQAAQGKVLHNDDTTMKVLELMNRRDQTDADDRAGSNRAEIRRRGIFTTGIVSVFAEHRIALFRTALRHAGENLVELLTRRGSGLDPPIQMCDALSRNMPKELDVLLGNCLAHARRQFVDVLEAFPEACEEVINRLAEVYNNDAHTREQNMDPAGRLRYHQQHSGPLMEQLRQWGRAQLDQRLVEPNSGLGQALNYMLKHWEPLTLFLREPGAPLDNNLCERALKKAILHRKNSMFYKTERGARVGDLFMSLIYTCELNGANALHYLTALSEHPHHLADAPDRWLPWNYLDALAAAGAS